MFTGVRSSPRPPGSPLSRSSVHPPHPKRAKSSPGAPSRTARRYDRRARPNSHGALRPRPSRLRWVTQNRVVAREQRYSRPLRRGESSGARVRTVLTTWPRPTGVGGRGVRRQGRRQVQIDRIDRLAAQAVPFEVVVEQGPIRRPHLVELTLGHIVEAAQDRNR